MEILTRELAVRKKLQLKLGIPWMFHQSWRAHRYRLVLMKDIKTNTFNYNLQTYMIVKLNNQVFFKAENSFPKVFEDVKISYHNTIARKTRAYKDCDNCRTRPIFSDNGVEMLGDFYYRANVKIKNLHLK